MHPDARTPRAAHADAAAPDALVRWRRRGPAAELLVAEPIGAPAWRRHVAPIAAMPAVGALAGVALGIGAAAGLFGVSLLVAWLANLPVLPLWALLGGVVLGPGIGGWVGRLVGRRRQRRAALRAAALDDVADSLGAAFGLDPRGLGGRALVPRVAETLRTGRPTVARVAGGRGAGEYRIDALGDGALRVTPLEPPVDESFIGQLVRALRPPAPPPSGPTAATDARMAELELRLATIERAGRIDRAHAAYPALVQLQVDRITEYRRLAARVEALAALPTDEARALSRRLERDLDEAVELMRVGVDELERDALGDAERDAAAHLAFLREKYAGPGPGGAGPRPGGSGG
ncbi:MAG: hypothetical protein GXX90_03330 [Microbacteriaceae bacterium]|nr:hypothetical protein [Microbacteriaceae bacterium]